MTYAWTTDVTTHTLPDPKRWIHEVCGDEISPALLDELEGFVRSQTGHPALQEWLNDMLDWGFGHPELLRRLLVLGARAQPGHLQQLFVNAGQFDGNDSDEDCADLVEAFVRAGASPNAVTAGSGLSRGTPVVVGVLSAIATVSQTVAMMRRLLDLGALPDGPYPDVEHNSKTVGHVLPLAVAMRSPQLDYVQCLLEKGASPERLTPTDWELANPVARQWLRAQLTARTLEQTLPATNAPSRPRI